MGRFRIVIFVAAIASQIACGQTQTNQNTSKPAATPASTAASEQKEYPNLKAQAKELAEAFSRKEFDKVASLTYPKLVEMMGGHEKMASYMSEGVQQIEARKVKFFSYTIGEPKDIISVGPELFAIVPSTLKMKVPSGILTSQSFMIGVSKDRGENWTFVDGSGGVETEKLKLLFPAAADKLKLPEIKQPVLEREP